MNEID